MQIKLFVKFSCNMKIGNHQDKTRHINFFVAMQINVFEICHETESWVAVS